MAVVALIPNTRIKAGTMTNLPPTPKKPVSTLRRRDVPSLQGPRDRRGLTSPGGQVRDCGPVLTKTPFDLGAQLSRQPCCLCRSQCLAHGLAAETLCVKHWAAWSNAS